VSEVDNDKNKGIFSQVMQQLQNKLQPARNDLKWNNQYKDIKNNFIEKFKDYGIKIKDVIRIYKNNNHKIKEIMVTISEFDLIKLDNKKAFDSMQFKKIQRDNWENIIKELNNSRSEIKKLILEN